ncbi:hypothetical protein [Octadecabacter ascidiaceicola]|uniref:Uncharacterized protein n=1 Tax=Octadecabacter ascidiaceicola TaxID=1655543 RepID=A0A238JS61_9RHOB|nr:hypothetical protein [Octadecabacter ascidiaceicola]SMX32586.1 hypothetical protein OCA8868_00773 [Octadecabacter ascidiaceicola]
MKPIAFAALLLASPAFAQDADEASVAAMTAAILDVDCLVTAENGDAVLEASGLSEEETMSVIATMYAAGSVALEADGSMKLIDEACE